jgi:hypothetical protein
MKDFSRTILKTSAAIAAMAAIGTYAYYWEFKKGAEETRRKEEAKKLFNFDKSGVISLDVTRDGKTVSLVKTAGWTIASPVKTDGDSTAVDQLITALANFKVERTTDEKPADLAPYGLDTPALRVTAKMAGDASAGLSIGAINQFDQTCYVMRDGDPRVYQASSSTRWSIDKDLFALRDKRIFTGDPSAEITRVEVRLPDKSYKSFRDGRGWSLEFEARGKVQKDRADEDEMTRIINAMRSVRAVGTAADGVSGPAAAGIDPLHGSISVWRGKDASREEVFFAMATKSDTPVLHAMRPGSAAVYELGEQFYNDLNKEFSDLRYKKPVFFNRAEVAKVLLRTDSGSIGLFNERADSGEEIWFVVGPEPKKAKAAKVGSMLYALQEMKAIEFAGDSPAVTKEAGLGNPNRTVEIFDGSGGRIARLEVGGSIEKGVYVRGSARSEVMIVDKSKAELIPMNPMDFLEVEQKPQP